MRTEKLPLLPRAAVDEHNLQGGRLLYTPSQMRAYGLACYQQAIEDAANVLTQHQIPVGNSAAGELACEWTYESIKECHAKILALAKEITP